MVTQLLERHFASYSAFQYKPIKSPGSSYHLVLVSLPLGHDPPTHGVGYQTTSWTPCPRATEVKQAATPQPARQAHPLLPYTNPRAPCFLSLHTPGLSHAAPHGLACLFLLQLTACQLHPTDSSLLMLSFQSWLSLDSLAVPFLNKRTQILTHQTRHERETQAQCLCGSSQAWPLSECRHIPRGLLSKALALG